MGDSVATSAVSRGRNLLSLRFELTRFSGPELIHELKHSNQLDYTLL